MKSKLNLVAFLSLDYFEVLLLLNATFEGKFAIK